MEGHQHLSQTGTSVYGFWENDINAGGSNSKEYSHHSQYWEDKVNE